MSVDRMDAVRQSVLTRMERAQRGMRLAIAGAAVAEMALLVLAITLVDLSDPVQRLVFVLSLLSYTIIALGLVALGAHVTHTVSRVLAAVDSSGPA